MGRSENWKSLEEKEIKKIFQKNKNKEIQDKPKKTEKIALALQGSFGHEAYALGIMAAFQIHNKKAKNKEYSEEKMNKPIEFIAASGCVEMLLPLWIYFNNKNIDAYFMKEYVNNYLFFPVLSLFWPFFPDTEYFQNVIQAHIDSVDNWDDFFLFIKKVFETGGMKEISLFSPYGMQFSPLFKFYMGNKIKDLMNESSVPVFTNAINAIDLKEIYLYAWKHNLMEASDYKGTKTQDVKKSLWYRIMGSKGREQSRRMVLRMDTERYFASGARPPILAPIKIDIYGETHHWMEGAMRCNPPLNPLMDLGVEKILLLRFFAKNKSKMIPDNVDLNDRYMETIFTAPLEKEMEAIDNINKKIDKDKEGNKNKVIILDPTKDPKHDYYYKHEPVYEFYRLLDKQLDFFSHYQTFNPNMRMDMFFQGQRIGQKIIEQYLKYGLI